MTRSKPDPAESEASPKYTGNLETTTWLGIPGYNALQNKQATGHLNGWFQSMENQDTRVRMSLDERLCWIG